MSMTIHFQSRADDEIEDPSRVCPRSLAAIRDQAAIVRALTDELERIVPSSWAEHPISEQLIEEMTCLGNKILAVASGLAGAAERPTSSVAPDCCEDGGQVPVS
jgi:hypothetical protein